MSHCGSCVFSIMAHMYSVLWHDRCVFAAFCSATFLEQHRHTQVHVCPLLQQTYTVTLIYNVLLNCTHFNNTHKPHTYIKLQSMKSLNGLIYIALVRIQAVTNQLDCCSSIRLIRHLQSVMSLQQATSLEPFRPLTIFHFCLGHSQPVTIFISFWSHSHPSLFSLLSGPLTTPHPFHFLLEPLSSLTCLGHSQPLAIFTTKSGRHRWRLQDRKDHLSVLQMCSRGTHIVVMSRTWR